MNPPVELKTERLFLRPLQLSDITEAYVNSLNDPEVNRYLFDARFHKQTRESVQKFVETNLGSPTGIFFGLFWGVQRELIGTLRVSQISNIHFSATLGICIFNKECWNQGLGTEAIQAVVEYLFKERGLHYVEAGAYVENQASITVFQKAGFTIQSQTNHKFRYDKNFMPVVVLGRVNKDFDYRQLESFE